MRYLEVSLEERGEERQWKSVTFGEDEIPGAWRYPLKREERKDSGKV
jgi:hypothetical protein